MFAVNVGDEVGTAFASSRSYLTASIHKVTKINGHGHIYLDNGDVYDKHGVKRTANKQNYSSMRLVEAKSVYADKAANAKRQQKRKIVDAVITKMNSLSNGYGDILVNKADKAELIALINSL